MLIGSVELYTFLLHKPSVGDLGWTASFFNMHHMVLFIQMLQHEAIKNTTILHCYTLLMETIFSLLSFDITV